ncbi:unnamed protein product [Timema podura]|uniref:Uncharacterized protein n=1 Tax=Timema podura TaxID=61482 RepID=A0ABN7P0V9_TIMPD|nr:unnamed protein product [Timema podura]
MMTEMPISLSRRSTMSCPRMVLLCLQRNTLETHILKRSFSRPTLSLQMVGTDLGSVPWHLISRRNFSGWGIKDTVAP